MTIDLVDNCEHFEDVYPSDPEDTSPVESDSSSESNDEPQAIKDLTAQIRKLRVSIKEATEERNSAQGRLNMLENYSRSLTTSRPADLTASVEAYETLRAKAFESHKNGEIKLEEHEQQMKKLESRRRKIAQKEKDRKTKDDKAKSKDEKKKEREKQQKIKEKKQVKQERLQFWPQKVYKIAVTLDANSCMTPASSRRGSISSIQKTTVPSGVSGQDVSGATTGDISKIDLSFSYITYSASWSPRYDLALDTTSKSGSITYRAEFSNKTSETWRDAKFILSTSQTSFQGLGEPIPQLQPWHVRLAKGSGDQSTEDALFSRSELLSKSSVFATLGQKLQAPRAQLYGGSSGFNNKTPTPFGAPLAGQNLFGNSGPAPPPPGNAPSSSFFSSSNNAPSGGLFGSSNTYQGGGQTLGSTGGGLFGSSNVPQQRAGVSSESIPSASAAPQLFGALQVQPNIALPQHPQAQATLAHEHEADFDTETIAPDAAALAFEESTWEEAGLTATYTVPGTKTIAPSNTTRRHKIASIPLSSITLSHIVVPKFRTAAFLKARLRNTSSTTLLKGPVGLTLDGSFLGNTTLPRSSPGEAFVLNLGVDPALNVVYIKPTVRRSQSGVFQKEGSRTYTRSCRLTNTKNNTAIEATVLDQIPVSEDDKLKVEVLIPRGLRKDEQAVKAGVGQINEGTGKKGSTYSEQSGGEEKVKWGKASAKMKEGEIEWDVKLNPGQGVKLELEYEARFPGGDGIVAV